MTPASELWSQPKNDGCSHYDNWLIGLYGAAMTSSMFIFDIAGSPVDAVAELAQDHEAALVWSHIKMAAVRTLDAIPASVLNGLTVEPREVNRDRWAVVHGLDQLLREHHAHSRAIRLGGNASLTWTAKQLASGLADEFAPPKVRRTRI